MGKKEKDLSVPRKPSIFIYNICVLIINILSKILVKVKIKRDPKLKELQGPIVCLGTHTAILDVAAMMKSMNRYRKLNIVVARDVLSWSVFKPISKKLGFIPMSQFGLDLSGVRMITRAVKEGRSIALFPEGKITLDGQNLHYIPPSLAKFLKMIGANVVFVHNNGAYCNNPKWASNFRKGLIVHDMKVLFTAEELKKASVDEIDKVIQNSFSFNDNVYQRQGNLRFKTKSPAKGLEYILYKCPKCFAEYENETDDRFISCKKCKNRVEYTEFGQLIPSEDSIAFDRIDIWYDWQRVSIRSLIAKQDFVVSKEVKWLKMCNEEKKYIDKGNGVLSISYNSIDFKGEDIDNNPISLSFPLESQFAIVQKTKEGVDLTIENEINRFMFVEGKYSAKYNLMVEEVFRKRHSLPDIGKELD